MRRLFSIISAGIETGPWLAVALTSGSYSMMPCDSSTTLVLRPASEAKHTKLFLPHVLRSRSCVHAVRMVAGAADAAAAADATPPAEDAAALLSPTAVAAVDASPARSEPV